MGKFVTYARGAICWPNLQPMQVAPSGGQICDQCKWRHLVAKFGINVGGAIWWPNCQLMQRRHPVVKFATNASGAIWWPNLRDYSSYGLNFWVRCASDNVCGIMPKNLGLHRPS